MIPILLSAEAIIMLACIFCFSYAIYHMQKGDTELAYFFVFASIFVKMLDIGLMLSVVIGLLIGNLKG